MKYTTTVMMVTYNGEKYVRDQLESIINQTIKPNQIVIADDYSTDNTVEIIKDTLKNTDVPYVIAVNEKNLGILRNGQANFHLCKGDILFVADQDNVWDCRFIERFLTKFESDDSLEYVFCNGYVTDEKLNILRDVYTDDFMNKTKQQFLLDALNRKGFPHGFSIVCKREFKERIRPNMFVGDEWAAICAGATGNIGSINEKLVYFRRHDSSFSKSEGGGKKEGFLFRIKRNDFGKWFVWPFTQVDAYTRYLELFGNLLDDEIKNLVEKHRDFESELDSLQYLGFFSRLQKLTKLSNTKEYRMYRGNRNTFIADFLFLCHYRIDKKPFKQSN